ncbi:hypothetical protein O181_038557 [Austropuccinia psidii MF-1]|uniref:Uncharacterized protein n=1 Tax=Austropuccinia psidii MF-1 TaxID=1389203 RepID=A0A9Q3DF01_9BASI|nr:hypothetical protein [Austropuccinia psidii MF-1]
MKPKGAKGGSSLAPKARWAHLSQFLTMDPNPPILAKNPKDPISNQGSPVAHFWPWPLETPRGHQLSSNPLFPSTQGEDLPFLHAPRTQGCRSGAYMVAKSITNFEGGLFSSSVWKSMAAIRRPFQDPNHLALKELALELAYKTCIHASTGKTPEMLQKGWNPKLPVNTLKKDLVNINLTSKSFKLLLDKVTHHANQSMNDAFEYAKQKWDKSHKTPEFKVGDLILV